MSTQNATGLTNQQQRLPLEDISLLKQSVMRQGEAGPHSAKRKTERQARHKAPDWSWDFFSRNDNIKEAPHPFLKTVDHVFLPENVSFTESRQVFLMISAMLLYVGSVVLSLQIFV